MRPRDPTRHRSEDVSQAEEQGVPACALLASREFARRVGIVPETLRRWVRAGRIKPHGWTPTGQLRFHPEQVAEVVVGPSERAADIEAHVLAARRKIVAMRGARPS